MQKKILIIVALLFIGGLIYKIQNNTPLASTLTDMQNLGDEEELEKEINLLSIEVLRKGNYPGSDFIIKETLFPGSNYQRYVVSYESENNKIFALLTIPNGEKPENGWPVIIFNHGYIPPTEYTTTERYVAYTDGFSRNGYIVLKSDYRGHGQSEGSPAGAYGSNGYTIDILNAVSSIKRHKDANPEKIGMWGHSLGGFLTLRSMVVRKDIKAGVVWAGVVGSYSDLLNNWKRGTFTPPPGISSSARRWRDALVEKYGTPEKNPQFWNSISANSYLFDISGPLQLHHGTADASVPVAFSQTLEKQMKDAGKEIELYVYQGDDHNITNYFGTAMQRSIEFFDKYLKN